MSNIHPANKQSVAARLALAARGMVYGEDIPFNSPSFHQVTTEADAMRVWFEHAEGLTTHGKPVEGFEIAGADHQFSPSEAMIDGQTVLVKNSAVSHPVYVRYAWCRAALKYRKSAILHHLLHCMPGHRVSPALKYWIAVVAYKRVMSVYVLKGRTNFRLNFVRPSSAEFRDLSAVNL